MKKYILVKFNYYTQRYYTWLINSDYVPTQKEVIEKLHIDFDPRSEQLALTVAGKIYNLPK